MREKINDIIGILVAAILTFFVFNIKLTPPETKTINLKAVVGVFTLTQEDLEKLMHVVNKREIKKALNLRKIKKRKYRKYAYKKAFSKRKKSKSSKKYKKYRKKIHYAKKTKLVKGKAYSKLKVKEKKSIEKKVLKKPIYLPWNEKKKVDVEGVKIPITYLEYLKEIIRSNYFYPKEALEKNIQGDVIVKFTLNKYGKLVEAKIIKSSSDILAQAALITIRRCKFPPFPSDLKYDEVSFIVKLRYQILFNNL